MRTLFSCTAQYTHWDCSLCHLLTLHQVESKLTIPKDSAAWGKLQILQGTCYLQFISENFYTSNFKDSSRRNKHSLDLPSFLGKVVFQFTKCKYWSYTVIIFTAKENWCHSHVTHLAESNTVKKTWSNLGDATM